MNNTNPTLSDDAVRQWEELCAQAKVLLDTGDIRQAPAFWSGHQPSQPDRRSPEMISSLRTAEIVFKLRYPDGQWVTLYADGAVDGVPDGTVIINGLHNLFLRLQARQSSLGQVPDSLRVYMGQESAQQSPPQSDCR